MRTVAIPRVVVSAIFAMVVLAGCRTDGPASTTPRDVMSGGAFDLLTQSGTFHEQRRALAQAEEVLVSNCMTANGFSHPVQPAGAAKPEVEQKRAIGYGLSPSHHRANEEAHSAEYLAALFGDDSRRMAIRLPDGGEATFPGHGCLFESRRAIFNDILMWARVTHVPESLSNRLADHVPADPAYVAAMRAWSECMHVRGHSYALPSDALQELTARYEAEGPNEQLRRQEIDTAVADAECAATVKISDVVRSIKKQHLNSLTAEEIQAMEQLSAAWTAAAGRTQ